MSIAKRSEIIFIYDITWANPNGDPLDANKPRIDIETGINFVTDVRLKRTIRDELYSRGYDILIRDIIKEDGSLADGKYRASQFLPEDKAKYAEDQFNELVKIINNNVISSCIDARLFGCTLPIELKFGSKIKKGSVTYTGPVQFKMGYSLHPVKCEFIKGTGAFASGNERDAKTFRQEYVLPYSLILFYGIVNNRAAEMTKLTEEEVNLMLDAMWYGTKNLISRTKVGQMPRILVRVIYKNGDFHIGELDKNITYLCDKSPEAIRDIMDGVLDFDKFIETLAQYKEQIEEVQIRLSDRIPIKGGINLIDRLKEIGISIQTL